jgi:hypothetical protein
MKIAPVLLLAVLGGCIGDSPADPPPDQPDPGNQPGDDGSDGSGGNLVDPSADAMPGCASVTTVIMYSEGTYELGLPNAFAANPDPCTRYYVHLPALSADKTMPRGGVANVHALGPNFHAMAEFSWGAWRDWIAASPGTRNWELAGQAFRQRMTDAGYDVAGGDTWAINEFPSTTRTGDQDVWTHEENAVKGLDEGDGTVSSKGVVYLEGMGQNLANFSVYKANVENWLQQDAFWNAMDSHVRWFSQEVYADPHFDCVIGSNVQSDADHLNAYLEHIPRLAANGGSGTQTAAAYLAKAYTPLVNESFNSDTGFGDNMIDLGDFERFTRLQVYGTHYWAANHNYPGRRIGFAWAPRNTTPDQDSALETIIANSVIRSYPSGGFYGLGKYACSTDGNLDGCGCTVSGSYNGGWVTFGTW